MATTADPFAEFADAPATTASPPADPFAQFKDAPKYDFDQFKDAAPDHAAAAREHPEDYAAANYNDPTAKDAAFEAYKAREQAPLTLGGAASATGQFLKGAIPTQDAQGNWHWPLGSGLYHFGKGIVDTAGQIVGTGNAAVQQGMQVGRNLLRGDNLTDAVANTPDDLEGERLSRQLGAGVESGGAQAAQMVKHLTNNIGAAGRLFTGRKLTDEELRQRFDDEVAFRYAQQQAAQGQYLHDIPGALEGKATGAPATNLSGTRTPAELAAAGYPINPEEVGAVSSTTNPANLVELGAITNPVVSKIVAPLVKGAGAAGEAAAGSVANLAQKAVTGPLAKLATTGGVLDAAVTGGAHLPYIAGGAAAAGATWAGAKLAQNAARIVREAGAEMAGEAPAVGQGFFRKTIKEGIKGAAAAVPGAALFAATGTTPEEMGEQFWNVIGMGAGIGALGGAARTRAIEAQAYFADTAKHGATVAYGDGADAAHNAIVSRLSSDAQNVVNFWRGHFDGATTPDGKPIRVQAVDDATFKAKSGQSSRGAYYADGTLLINVESQNGGMRTAPELAQTFAHEGKHAIDTAQKAAQPKLYNDTFDALRKALTTNGGTHATPEFIEWIQDQMQAHHNNLVDAGATPEQIDAAMRNLGDLDYWLNEASADIGQGLLTGGDMGRFMLTPGMTGRISDAVRDVAQRNGLTGPQTGALGLAGAQGAVKAIRKQLYGAGAAARARIAARRTEGINVGQRIAELTPIASRPITAQTPMAEREETRKAQRDLAELQKDTAPKEAPFPAAGPAPAAPSKPGVIVSPDAVTKDALKALEVMSIKGPKANALIRQANQQHGSPINDAGKLAAAAFRIHGGGAIKPGEFEAKPEAPKAPVAAPASGTKFRDETGTERIVSGTSPDAPRVGDIVATREGEIRRVTRALGSTVDTARPIDPLNARGTKTHKIEDVATLTHDYAPSAEKGSTGQPESTAEPPVAPAGQTLTVKPFGDRFTVVDAAGNPINKTTYASEKDAQQAIAQQGRGRFTLLPNPHGAPDILDAIMEQGGINLSKLSKEEREAFIADPHLRRILSTDNPSLTPDEVARLIAPSEEEPGGYGDGSVSTLPGLIEAAYNARKSGKAQNAKEAAAQRIAEREAKKNAPPNEPTEPKQDSGDEISKGGTTVLAREVPAPPPPAEPVRKRPTPPARQAVDAIVAEAERAAIAAEKRGTESVAAQERIYNAKVNAIMDAIGDDPTGLHRVTDAAGNTKIVGNFDIENTYHAALVDLAGGITEKADDNLDNLQRGQGNVHFIRYRSAKSQTEDTPWQRVGMTIRRGEYVEDPAAERTEGTIQQKAIIPIETTFKGGRPMEVVFTLDNLLHNAESLKNWISTKGEAFPYADERLLTRDVKVYADNHAHGWKGDGSAPIKGFPDSELPRSDLNYKAETIPKERFDLLNMLMHSEDAGKLSKRIEEVAAKRQKVNDTTTDKARMIAQGVLDRTIGRMKTSEEAYALAGENNPWVNNETGESNQLRDRLKAEGFDTNDAFKSPFETLDPQHILDMADKPLPLKHGEDIKSVRPTSFVMHPSEMEPMGRLNPKAVAANFMPEENSTKTPREKAQERIEARASFMPENRPSPQEAAQERQRERTTTPFYSQLTRTIQELPQETMTIAQARAAIEKGSKPDEQKMSGIFNDPLSPLYQGTKPNRTGKPLSDFLRGQDAPKASLNGMDPVVIGIAQHDQIRRDVISKLPVDVMAVLHANQITTDQLFSEPSVVGTKLPIDVSRKVALGLSRAIEQAIAPLRAKLARTLISGGDGEIAPALRASDLTQEEVKSLFSGYGSGDYGSPDAASVSGKRGTAFGAEDIRGSSMPLEKGSSASLAELLNRHREMLSETSKHVNDKVTKSELLSFALERQAKVHDVVLSEKGKIEHADLADVSKEIGSAIGTFEDVFNETDERTAEASEKFDGYLEKAQEAADRDDLETTREYVGYASSTENDFGDNPATSHILKMLDKVNQTTNETHFKEYQLPGADEGSYREMFVTWPEAKSAVRTELPEGWTVQKTHITNLPSREWDVYNDKGVRIYGGFSSPAEAKEITLGHINRNGEGNWRDGHGDYSDIANPIVRIRRNLRTDADGKKTLFIEEIQGPGKGEQEKMPPELRKRIYEIGMKRALRDAVAEGASSLSWTTGEQQAERYSLEKHLDSVKVLDATAKGRKGFDVTGYKDGQALIVKANVAPEELESVIGKELAGKIMADYGNHTLGLGDFAKTYSGVDLKVGGEGLKRLYDQTLPRIANELAKKFGVKVGEENLQTGPDEEGQWKVMSEGGETEFGPTDRESAQRYASRNGLEIEPINTAIKTAHSLPIPDALRAQQRGGNALFMPETTLADDMKAQAPWIDEQMKARGFAEGISDQGDEAAIARMKLAAEWRLRHARDKEGNVLSNRGANTINRALYGRQKDPSNEDASGRGIAGTADALEDATRHAGAGAGGGEADSPEERIAQRDALKEWAKKTGLLIDRLPKNKTFAPNDEGGMEHDVWFDDHSQRWIKATRGIGSSMGMKAVPTKDGWALTNASPKEYLESRKLWNKTFGDDIRLHGVWSEGGNVNLITSQPHVEGRQPTQREITDKMEAAGFMRMDDSTYYRKSDNVAVFDLHDRNAKMVGESLFPFDGIIMHPSPELLDALKDSRLALLNRRPIPSGKDFLEMARNAEASTGEKRAVNFMPDAKLPLSRAPEPRQQPRNVRAMAVQRQKDRELAGAR